MKEKAGAVLMCLLFGLPFGAVGVFAFWMAGTMVYDGWRARDWVLVKAEVQEGNYYRYRFGGREFRNNRLGAERIEGTSDVDDFDERVAQRFARAREENKPMTVYVNPDNPAESMVDREIRWTLFLVMFPFAFGFGGVGLGALFVIYKILADSEKKGAKAAERIANDSTKGPAFLWIFAFFWNVISFPIALVVVPQAIADGEWAGLLVLLFPLVGVLVLWGAVGATMAHFRRKGRRKSRTPAAAPAAATPATSGDFTSYAEKRPMASLKPSAAEAKFDSLEKVFAGHVDFSRLSPEQRAMLAKVTPEQRAAIEKVVRFAPRLKKLVFGLVLFIVAMQVIPFVFAMLAG